MSTQNKETNTTSRHHHIASHCIKSIARGTVDIEYFVLETRNRTSLNTLTFLATTMLSSQRTLSLEPSPPPTHILPKLDFGYDELRDKMSAFTLQFDSFIEKSRRKVLASKNDFQRTLAENTEMQKQIQLEIENLKQKNREMLSALDRDEREEKECEGQIREMAKTEERKAEHQAALEERIAELKQIIEKRREKRGEQRRWVEKQSGRNGPELMFWEQILGMRIEGVEVGSLKIVFTNVHPKVWTKEYEFVFRLDQKEYEGKHRPKALKQGEAD